MDIIIPQELREKHSSIARKILQVTGDPYAQHHIDRFFGKIEMSENGCWLVRCGLTCGYARLKMYGRMVFIHRWTYILFKGEIPEEMQLDHLCRTRNCVNPDHLEAVTRRENILRGVNFSAMNARKTHCIHGHPLTEDNTYISSDDIGYRRSCKTCACERSLRRYYKKIRLS